MRYDVFLKERTRDAPATRVSIRRPEIRDRVGIAIRIIALRVVDSSGSEFIVLHYTQLGATLVAVPGRSLERAHVALAAPGDDRRNAGEIEDAGRLMAAIAAVDYRVDLVIEPLLNLARISHG
jgi:hypothetical protein